MSLIQTNDRNEDFGAEYGSAIASNRNTHQNTGEWDSDYDYDAEYGSAIRQGGGAGLVEPQQPDRKMNLVRSLPSSSVWATVQQRVEFLEEIADFLEDYPSTYLPHIDPIPEVRSLDNGQTLPFPTGIPNTDNLDSVSMSLPAIVYRTAEKEISRKTTRQGVLLFTPAHKKLTKPGIALFSDLLGIEEARGIAASSVNVDLDIMLAPFGEHDEFSDPELVAAFYRQIAYGVSCCETGVLPSGAVPKIAQQVIDMPKSGRRQRKHKVQQETGPVQEIPEGADAQSAGGPPLLLHEIPAEQQQQMMQQQQEPRRAEIGKKLLKTAAVFTVGGALGAAGLAGVATVSSFLVVGGMVVGVPAYLAIKLKGDFKRLRESRRGGVAN